MFSPISLVGLATILTLVSAEVQTVSRCYREGAISLQCPHDSLLRVYNVTYGRSESNSCSYENGDCTHTEQTSYGCNGKRRCVIVITEQTRYLSLIPSCKKQGNYLRVTYECVKETDIADVCTPTLPNRTATKGYIATPSFAHGNYYGSLNCQYFITGRNIKLHFITVNLTDQHDCLEIHNSLRAKTFCGGKGVVENYDITDFAFTNQVRVTFKSGSGGHMGGVWIYYEKQPLPIVVERPTVPARTTTLPSVILDKRPETTIGRESWTEPIIAREQNTDADINIYNNASSRISNSMLATILGLVFGLLGTLILVLFVIYFTKRYRDHKRKRARRRSGGNEHVMWHNITNECLSEILTKHESATEQRGYSNNVMPKEDSITHDPQYLKHIEHNFC